MQRLELLGGEALGAFLFGEKASQRDGEQAHT